MPKFKALPPLEELQKLFRYDEETGILYRIYAPKNKYLIGKPAGAVNGNGYLQVNIDKKIYPLHRIIWFLVTGEDPGSSDIDHKDSCKTNNKFSNLRKATRSQNQANRQRKGYKFDKESGKYHARVGYDKKTIHIGVFSTAEEAQAAYRAKAVELHGEFAFEYD